LREGGPISYEARLSGFFQPLWKPRDTSRFESHGFGICPINGHSIRVLAREWEWEWEWE